MSLPSSPISGSRPVLFRATTLLALGALAGLIAVLRLHTYDEPLNVDITGYAVTSHEMLSGRHLYSEAWDHKPPAIYVTFALAERLWGYGNAEIYGLNVTAAIITLIGVYAAGSAFPWDAATAACGPRPSGLRSREISSSRRISQIPKSS